MESKEQEEQLLEELRILAKKDPVKTTIVDITALGLLEITRKKTKKSLKQQLSVDFSETEWYYLWVCRIARLKNTNCITKASE